MRRERGNRKSSAELRSLPSWRRITTSRPWPRSLTTRVQVRGRHQQHRGRLSKDRRLTKCSDLRVKLAQAIDIRDNIETYCQGQQYGAFLNHLVPLFLKVLDGAPVFISTSPDQVSSDMHDGPLPRLICRSGFGTACSRSSTDCP